MVAELALCTFLCFAGLPQQDASGWILDNLEEDEFVRIENIAEYLSENAKRWKRPRHVTECEDFSGKVPKGLNAELRRMQPQEAVEGSGNRTRARETSNTNTNSKPESDGEENQHKARGGQRKKKRKSGALELYSLNSYWNAESSRPRKKRRTHE